MTLARLRIRARSRGFTLIELLVVIAIIGLLSSVVLASLRTARTKARDARRLADIREIQTALEMYYNDNKFYPASTGAIQPNSGWSTSNDSSWPTLATALQPYMSVLPTDPAQSSGGWGGSAFAYSYFSGGYGCPQRWYMIVFQLENTDGKPDPGVTACDGTFFDYGGNSGPSVIKTVGQGK